MEKFISTLRQGMWGGVRREASETENRGGMRLSDGVRQKQVKDAEEGNCGKSVRRMGMVMRRVYQLFRCCLLIKHHQTLNLLTINTLLHYHVFSPPSFPSSLFLFLFPSGSLSLSLCLPVFPFLLLLLFIKHPQCRPD